MKRIWWWFRHQLADRTGQARWFHRYLDRYQVWV